LLRIGEPVVPARKGSRDGAARDLRGLEEGERERLLSLAQDVEGEGPRLLDERVRVRVDLDAHHDERWLECDLRDPVHRGGRHLAVLVRGREHVQPVGNHPQRGLLRVGVHQLVLPGLS